MTETPTSGTPTSEARRRVAIGSGPDSIRTLKAALINGLLPDTYVSAGALVHMEQISGDVAGTAADEDSPLPVTASPIDPPVLAGLLAEHAHVYRRRSRKTSTGSVETFEEETTPAAGVLSAVLAGKTWPGVPALRGVIGAPVLRRDGTLLQRPGYDPATGLYLAAKVDLPEVPERPTAEQVAEARHFLLGRFLADFPWSSPADRANYIGLLITPIVRHYTRSLTPFGVIDATMPASGKTILTAGPGMLYGQRVLPWAYEDVELRKSITAVFAEQVGAVIWDNLAEGTVIDSAVLAQLVTGPVWSDRLLGSSRTAAAVNDRLWLATGNNLQVGGDMASRTVRVHLDPDMPRPEERDQSRFGIPHLDQWITVPANQMELIWHLLVLVLDWIQAGAPRARGLSMRQFTPWAQACGGFLTHHGITGFLDNAAEVRQVDEDEMRWMAFLSTWHHRHGSTPMTAAELRRDAETELVRHRFRRPVGRAVHHHPQRQAPQPAQPRAAAHRAERPLARQIRRARWYLGAR
ncbi:hypothetical protein F4553_005387 [Allocatelliglobosispora scoriae]|uniref:Uncharacterized protein n=1 Tax=Allocatelliglobosispora scoriae TaxID=643052 RepID=A0A841BWY4_9ACTN|nr:hypothetical protein [Allocatelliglobosispora scoriae]MBB5872008.1 hypothetical protein [Allocatelliglobosispora scoriae]